MGVNTRNMWSRLQKCNKLNKLHLVGQLLNSIHDARTHVYKNLGSCCRHVAVGHIKNVGRRLLCPVRLLFRTTSGVFRNATAACKTS